MFIYILFAGTYECELDEVLGVFRYEQDAQEEMQYYMDHSIHINPGIEETESYVNCYETFSIQEHVLQ